MPKLKESEDDKIDRLFKAITAKNMMLCGYIYNKDLAPKMHMHINTLNYKVNDPDKFDRKELKRLFRLLKFTDEEKGTIMWIKRRLSNGFKYAFKLAQERLTNQRGIVNDAKTIRISVENFSFPVKAAAAGLPSSALIRHLILEYLEKESKQ